MSGDLARFSCPWCKERFSDWLTECPACGQQVGGQCLKCGAWVWIGWVECRQCGEPWALGLLQAARKKRQENEDKEWWAARQKTVPEPPSPPPPPPPEEPKPRVIPNAQRLDNPWNTWSVPAKSKSEWVDVFIDSGTEREDDRIELLEAALLASGQTTWLSIRSILGLTWIVSLVAMISLLFLLLLSDATSALLWGAAGSALLCFAGFAGQAMGDAHFCKRLRITDRLLGRIRKDPGERNKFLNELKRQHGQPL